MDTDTILLIVSGMALVNIVISIFLATMLSKAQNEIAATQREISATQHRVNMVGALTNKVQESGVQIYRDIGVVRAATDQMLDMRNDISNLQKLLQSSRQRGKLGEVLLSTLLEDALPSSGFEMQHQFRNGKRVDTIIKLERGIIPVDSKFPLTNYETMITAQTDELEMKFSRQFLTDVRGHIDAVMQYIIPSEGTLDFALMFIPSEAVYYEIINQRTDSGRESLVSYAFSKRVFPVSPNTFYPYLLTIARGLRELYVADHTRETIQDIAQLETEFDQQVQNWEKARRQIDNARNNLGTVQASLDTISEMIKKIGTPDQREMN